MKRLSRYYGHVKSWILSRNLMWCCGLGTSLYVSSILVLMGSRFGELSSLQLNELGDFFAGAFGPPAFFWLVLGQVQQRRDIAKNAEAYERSLEPALTLRFSRTEQTETGPADFFVISNYGPYCTKVAVMTIGHNLKEITTYLNPLVNGEGQEFGIGQHLPDDGFYKVRFTYQKQSGALGVRVFGFCRNTIDGKFYFVVIDDVESIPKEYFK